MAVSVPPGSVGIDWLAPSTIAIFLAFHASIALYMGAAVYWRLFTDGRAHARRWGVVAFFVALLGSVGGVIVVFVVYYLRTGELLTFDPES